MRSVFDSRLKAKIKRRARLAYEAAKVWNDVVNDDVNAKDECSGSDVKDDNNKRVDSDADDSDEDDGSDFETEAEADADADDGSHDSTH